MIGSGSHIDNIFIKTENVDCQSYKLKYNLTDHTEVNRFGTM